jgi:hypothetical protein
MNMNAFEHYTIKAGKKSLSSSLKCRAGGGKKSSSSKQKKR